MVSLPRLHRRSPTHRRHSPQQRRKRHCKCVSATHGGLTPAALVYGVRSAVKKRLLRCTNASSPKRERGASVPVPIGQRTRKGMRLLRCTNACARERGGVSPPWIVSNAHATVFANTPSAVSSDFAEAFLQLRLRSHGGLTPAAPGACRLCIVKVAILPAGERARTRAGGVSPPWFRYRVCTGVRQHTVGKIGRAHV